MSKCGSYCTAQENASVMLIISCFLEQSTIIFEGSTQRSIPDIELTYTPLGCFSA